jgi:serine/threonine protein kinase
MVILPVVTHVPPVLLVTGPLDPYVVKSLMWQLLNGLSYLHQNWVIHRDLKVNTPHTAGEYVSLNLYNTCCRVFGLQKAV